MLLTTGAAAQSEDTSAEERLSIEVLRLNSGVPNETLRDLNRTLQLHLRVTNQSDAPVILKRDDVRLLCAQEECTAVSPQADEVLPDEQELPPGETTDAWVAFKLSGPSPQEPSLELTVAAGPSRQSIPLNEVLRDLVNPRTRSLGYRERITVLSIERTIDLPTVWVLDEQFRLLKQQGVDRLVLVARPAAASRLPDKVSRWLQLANESLGHPRRRMVRGYPPPARFREFHLTGFKYVNSGPGGIMHQSRELAVAAAARTLYQRLATEDAVAEYQSEEPGIRRAALESSIDRMSAAQLAVVLDSVPSVPASDRRMILGLLDRAPGDEGVETLRTTLMNWLTAPPGRSDALAPKTAEIAAQTLVRCVVPETATVLHDVWTAAAANRLLRDTMIQEILRTRDHRWTDLVAEYATSELDRFSPGSVDDQEADQAPARRVRISRVLRDSVRFLHGNDDAFTEVAEQRLLDVTAPDVQDELLRIVAEGGEEDLARECIEQRLARGAVTRQLLTVIQQLPDSNWTMRLVELHSSKNLPGYDRASTLTTALRCATDTQLDEIIDGVDELDRSVRPYLYKQLVSMRHPRCAELLARALESDETEFNRALRDLPAAESPEMLQLVINRYELYRLTAIERGGLEGDDYRLARALLSQLGPADHPEARRMINLSLISPDPGLRNEAMQHLARRHARSRGQTRKQEEEVRQLRRQGRLNDAMDRISRLIEQDPFCADFLLTRSSLFMRMNRIDEAQDDVLEADRLSPADVFTESTLALLKVRSGDVESGVSDAEQVLTQVPTTVDLYYDGTLYNTACVYARALERPELTPEQIQQYTERAIELMHQSADAGFHDEDHVANDPDLVTLHDHAEWTVIMQKITSNQAP